MGAPEVVSTSKAVANRAKQTLDMVKEATGLDLDMATVQAMITEIKGDVPGFAAMKPDDMRAAGVRAIQARGSDYWVNWLAGRQGAAPRSPASAPAARRAPTPEPSAAALDEAVSGGDLPGSGASTPPPPTRATPAAGGRTRANQAPSKQSQAMRAWLVRYGEKSQAEVDAMDDQAVAVAKAEVQRSRSGGAGKPAAATTAPAAGSQSAKRTRGRPRGSKSAGAAVTTEDEGVVSTADPSVPSSNVDLENLSAEQLQELLTKARVREATRGSQIDVNRGPVGPLPAMDDPPAGLGIGADELIVNKFGGTQTTAGAAAPTPPPPSPGGGGGGGGGPPDPPDGPEEPGYLPAPYNPFGVNKVEQGGKTVYKDRWGRAALRYFGVPAAVATGAGATWMMSGSGKPQVSQDELEMLRQRAIEGRMRNQELWGTYQDKPAPIQMAPPDMPAPPENNIRAFQRGVR